MNNNKKDNKIKVYVVGEDDAYGEWITNCNLVRTMANADLVVLTGGSDVDPSYYDDVKGEFTYTNINRDKKEIAEIDRAIALEKPMLGICRGLQILAVKAGAKLIQHMQHPGKHLITMYDGSKMYTNSYHHQLVKPFHLGASKYKIIGYAEALSEVHLNGNGAESLLKSDKNNKSIEPEIVYFPEIKALGIQGHPEMLPATSQLSIFSNKLIRLLINDVLEAVLEIGVPVRDIIENALDFKESELKTIRELKDNRKFATEIIDVVN